MISADTTPLAIWVSAASEDDPTFELTFLTSFQTLSERIFARNEWPAGVRSLMGMFPPKSSLPANSIKPDL